MLASARPHPPPIQPGFTYGGGKDLMGDLMGDMMVDIITKKYFVAKKYLLHQYVTISIDLSASEVRHQYSSEIEEVYHDVKHQLSSQ